ncbi:MAG: MBL fold metallo-hydrolase [Eubacteriales bacterium]|nr:MBL fold metallo-hydrolase [Eubacteriales bacterium]
MLRSLISGSSGNCSLLSYRNTNILVDCGMSGKRLDELLSELNLSGIDLDAILVTHEHIDHISGIGVASRKYNLPIYATEQTHLAMNIGRIADENIKIIEPDRPFEIGFVTADAFSIPHDAADPVGYRFYCGKDKFSVATDIGTMTDELFDSISGSKAVILEANHDIDMLLNGSYSEPLKRRILGNFGHMSNELSAKTALALVNRGTTQIMLSHLSDENNTPELAYKTVSERLEDGGVKDSDVQLIVANRYEVSTF